MWVFLNNAFLSIVADRNTPERLLVRARFEGDIERIFPDAVVTETPDADYRFRAFLPRETVANAIAAALTAMTATNFKSSVKDRWRHDIYLDVWSTMSAAQNRQRSLARRSRSR